MSDEGGRAGNVDHDAERIRLQAENAELRAALEVERARVVRLSAEAEGLETFFRAASHAVVFFDREGRVMTANPAVQPVLGLRPGEVVGRAADDPCWGTVRPDGTSLPGSELPASVALRTGEPVRDFVVGVRHPETGVLRWLLVTAVPVFRPGEERPHRVCTCFADITTMESERRALEQARQRVQSLLESSPMGIHRYRLEAGDRLVFVGANPAADALLGVSNAQYVGKTIEEAFPSLAATEVPARYRAAARDGTAWHTEHIVYADDQIAGAFEVHAFQTAPGEMAAFFLEITERKRNEAALRASEERFRLIFKDGPLGMALANGDLRFTAVNDALGRMLGRTAEDLRGLPLRDVLHPDHIDASLAAWSRVMVGELGVHRDEIRFLRVDGTEAWGAVTVTRVLNRSGQCAELLAMVEDIDERVRARQERRALEARLLHQQKLEAIGTLAAGVAHEINNPLNGILNFAELLASRLGGDGPERSWAQSIVVEAERVGHIVKDLLTFSRYEKQSHSEAHMADIVRGILSLVGAVLRKDQIQVEVDVPGDLPSVRCRTQQIQQVLLNLLTNARDALNERYVGHHDDKRVAIRCREFHRDGRRWLRTTVEDHGAGIALDVAPRIFDPFFTTKPRDLGTGLGLSLSFSIVREHHGELWFETDQGNGTRFHIDLPVDNGWRLDCQGNG